MTGSDSSEDDFMSDKFLQDPSSSSKANSSQPHHQTYSSLRLAAQRRSESKAVVKSRKEIEEEARREGLERNLFDVYGGGANKGTDNDGVWGDAKVNGNAKRESSGAKDVSGEGRAAGGINASGGSKAMEMMFKMGYKVGTGLGKKREREELEEDEEEEEKKTKKNQVEFDEDEESSKRGLGSKPSASTSTSQTTKSTTDPPPPSKKPRSTIEPLPIHIRSGRAGISSTKPSSAKPRLGDPNARLEGTGEFRDRARQEFEDRKAEGSLRAVRRTCEDLDRRNGVESSLLWLDPFTESQAAHRLRRRIQMGDIDPEELESPPGTPPPSSTLALSTSDGLSNEVVELEEEREESQRGRSGKENENESKDEEIEKGKEKEEWEKFSKDEWLELDARIRLSYTLTHLRSVHHYCFFCGAQYDSMEEMEKECPGLKEDDHE